MATITHRHHSTEKCHFKPTKLKELEIPKPLNTQYNVYKLETKMLLDRKHYDQPTHARANRKPTNRTSRT